MQGTISLVLRFRKRFFYYSNRRYSRFKLTTGTTPIKQLEIIGELESDVLEVLKTRGQGTAADVMEVLQGKREIAYTTVSTTLDRLYKKRLVERKALPGPGGTKYLFSLGKDEKLKRKIIESTIDRLTSAFGETAYSAIYRKLDSLPESELDRLKKQVDKARRKK
ncbi:MAG TPA: BlaI/MecI/CopY family transcriptional regulator [Nitrososphaerales archaeon]|nr:BlaI/MecI/CopY family transcriptional regulator [Nitrososphaerales archaeon]